MSAAADRRPLTCVRLNAAAAAIAPDRCRTDVFPPQNFSPFGRDDEPLPPGHAFSRCAYFPNLSQSAAPRIVLFPQRIIAVVLLLLLLLSLLHRGAAVLLRLHASGSSSAEQAQDYFFGIAGTRTVNKYAKHLCYVWSKTRKTVETKYVLARDESMKTKTMNDNIHVRVHKYYLLLMLAY
jgi:hypothetical protein